MTAALTGQTAEQAITAFRRACVQVSERTDALVALQQERPKRKLEALCRMCAEKNPASGKAFTVTQAEDLLQTDPDYASYRVRIAEAEAVLKEAVDEREIALLNAQLRLAEFKISGGLQ